MEFDELLSLMQTRRTIRAIKTDPIPDEDVQKILEAARWAPTGFNMQPNQFVVVKDEALRTEIKWVVDDYKNSDFYPMEATREEWQGHPWTMATHGAFDLPLAARYSRQKGDSIFESSLSNAFMFAWLAAHSLGYAVCPISAVKYPKLQGLVKHILNLPDYIWVYDILMIGKSEMDPGSKLTRPLSEMVHYERVKDGEFMDEETLRKQIKKLRAGNVARHGEAGQ